jgi:hypothetical protein
VAARHLARPSSSSATICGCVCGGDGRGDRPDRTSDDEITIFDSTGTAIQDVAAAVIVFKRARG